MGTTIDSRGVVVTPGSSFTAKGTVIFEKGTQLSSTAIVAASTVAAGGLYTVSGTSAVTITLADPADVPGSTLIFRSLSTHAHLLSSSLVAQDTTTITDGTNVGARLALPDVVGSSVVLVSDGVNYIVTGNSGTFTLATPSS